MQENVQKKIAEKIAEIYTQDMFKNSVIKFVKQVKYAIKYAK
jgi:hypothetical protein